MTADACVQHRPYLAALADGELDLVPPAAREHILACDGCSRELETHQLLSSRLRAAVRAERRVRAAPTSTRLLPLAAAAAVAAVLLGVQLVTHSGPDALSAAVLVADKQPAYWSSNPVDIAAWCSEKYGNRVPTVAVPGLQAVGARMDWPDGIGVATVTYRLEGREVHVSWLANSFGSRTPAEVMVNGHPAVVVRSHGITAVVTGQAAEPQLESIAREIASAR